MTLKSRMRVESSIRNNEVLGLSKTHLFNRSKEHLRVEVRVNVIYMWHGLTGRVVQSYKDCFALMTVGPGVLPPLYRYPLM